MGLPTGWVTDLPLPRTAQLRALGNSVMPQQAAHALGLLLADQLSRPARRAVGWTLLGIGAATTVPIAVSVFRRSSAAVPGPGPASV